MAQHRQDGDPILWADKAVRERHYRKDGKRFTKRFPQTAQGLARRWRYVVDDSGNVLHLELTNAAAEGDLDGPSARQRRAKWRALGWYEYGRCPVALMHAGQLLPDHLSEGLRKKMPCTPGSYSEKEPCPCARAERAARMAEHQGVMAARLPRMKDLGEQMSDLQREQIASSAELVGAFKEAIQTIAEARVIPERQSKKGSGGDR